MFWVQQVDMVYSKLSRGMPGAKVRNSTPRVFPMITGNEKYAYEQRLLLESDKFSGSIVDKKVFREIPKRINLLIIQVVKTGLELGLQYNSSVGRPKRDSRKRGVLLDSGQIAKLYINGRHTSHSGRKWYTETVYNVAFGEQLDAEVFVCQDPVIELDLREILF